MTTKRAVFQPHTDSTADLVGGTTGSTAREALENKGKAALAQDLHQEKLDRLKAEIATGSYQPKTKNVAAAIYSALNQEIFISKFEDKS